VGSQRGGGRQTEVVKSHGKRLFIAERKLQSKKGHHTIDILSLGVTLPREVMNSENKMKTLSNKLSWVKESESIQNNRPLKINLKRVRLLHHNGGGRT